MAKKEETATAAGTGDQKSTPQTGHGSAHAGGQGVLEPFEIAYRDFIEALYRIAAVVTTEYGEAYREYLNELEEARGDPGKQQDAYRRFIEKVRHVWDKARQETLAQFHAYTNSVHTLWAEIDVKLVSPEVAAAMAVNLYNAGYWTRAAEYNLWLALTYSVGGLPY